MHREKISGRRFAHRAKRPVDRDPFLGEGHQSPENEKMKSERGIGTGEKENAGGRDAIRQRVWGQQKLVPSENKRMRKKQKTLGQKNILVGRRLGMAEQKTGKMPPNVQ